MTPYDDRSGSTLAQEMACCLTAPSHDLHQYWPQPSITKICLKITYIKCHSISPGVNELTLWYQFSYVWYCIMCISHSVYTTSVAFEFIAWYTSVYYLNETRETHSVSVSVASNEKTCFAWRPKIYICNSAEFGRYIFTFPGFLNVGGILAWFIVLWSPFHVLYINQTVTSAAQTWPERTHFGLCKCSPQYNYSSVSICILLRKCSNTRILNGYPALCYAHR